MRLNADAQAAVAAARSGQCREAMKHLYEAAPHRQGGGPHGGNCSSDSKVAEDFRLANIIVAGKCTVDKRTIVRRRAGRPVSVESSAGFGRARRAKKRKVSR